MYQVFKEKKKDVAKVNVSIPSKDVEYIKALGSVFGYDKIEDFAETIIMDNIERFRRYVSILKKVIDVKACLTRCILVENSRKGRGMNDSNIIANLSCSQSGEYIIVVVANDLSTTSATIIESHHLISFEEGIRILMKYDFVELQFGGDPRSGDIIVEPKINRHTASQISEMHDVSTAYRGKLSRCKQILDALVPDTMRYYVVNDGLGKWDRMKNGDYVSFDLIAFDRIARMPGLDRDKLAYSLFINLRSTKNNQCTELDNYQFLEYPEMMELLMNFNELMIHHRNPKSHDTAIWEGEE